MIKSMGSAAKLLGFKSQQSHLLIMTLAQFFEHSRPQGHHSRKKKKIHHRIVIWGLNEVIYVQHLVCITFRVINT